MRAVFRSLSFPCVETGRKPAALEVLHSRLKGRDSPVSNVVRNAEQSGHLGECKRENRHENLPPSEGLHFVLARTAGYV